jgi:acetylcholinesterase
MWKLQGNIIKILIAFSACILMWCPVHAGSVVNDDLIVETSKGKIQGFETSNSENKKVSAWYGIPYAQPPTGNLRFRHPRSVDPWEGVKNTLDQPNSCVQMRDTMWPGFDGAEEWNTNTKQSEDCLYLNVVVPRPHPKDAAVIIWIYGGGFWSGTTTLALYDLRTMVAEQNIIMVGIQYRVASLAFLFFDTEDVPGNAGMFDQLMAIQWVKENIAQFGGNPENITLMGESAGAASVSLHLLSPLSTNLFSQAIMQSASALAPWAVISKNEGMHRSLRLAELMGCPHDGREVRASIDCLRKADPHKMVVREWDGITHGFTGAIGVFVPIVDGAFLDENPGMAMRLEHFKKTNILLGSNKDEGNYFILYFFADAFPKQDEVFISREQFLASIKDAYPLANKLQRKAIEFEYTNWINPDDPVKNRVGVDRFTGDWQFTCPVVDFAHRYAETGNNVYMYHFAQQATVSPWPKWSGAMHADEIAFLFGQPLNVSHGYAQAEIQLSRQMMAYWANFAKTGNPSLSADHTWTETYWPLHTPLKRETLTLSTSESKVLEGHGVRKCAFWKKFLPQLGNGRFDGRSGDFFHQYPGNTPAVDMRPESGRQKACELECCNAGLFTGPTSSTVLFSAILIIFLTSSSF